MGPSGVAVRKIVGPHAVVLPPPRENMTANRVIEESCIDLLVEVFAGTFLDEQALALGAMAFEVIVPLLQDKRDPAQLVFHKNDFKFGEAFEHAGIDQVVEAIHRLKEFHIDAIVLRSHASWGI